MRIILFLSLFFSFPVFATTLGEIGAAAAIANKLQETGQADSASLIKQAKEKLEQYNEAEKRKLASIVSGNVTPPASDPVEGSQPQQNLTGGTEDLKHLTEREIEERFQDQGIEPETEPVDYKAGIQVFYKNKCSASQKDCSKGAVLTNIKSVIFDYAQSRGSFAKSVEK